MCKLGHEVLRAKQLPRNVVFLISIEPDDEQMVCQVSNRVLTSSSCRFQKHVLEGVNLARTEGGQHKLDLLLATCMVSLAARRCNDGRSGRQCPRNSKL